MANSHDHDVFARDGEIPPYYKEDELSADPRTLCFNLQTREFQFLSRSMQEDPSWQLVTDFAKTVSWLEKLLKLQVKDHLHLKV